MNTKADIKKQLLQWVESIDPEQQLTIEINYGHRYTTPADENHEPWINKKINDGSFVMIIKGDPIR
jgi:hypothetical protein